MVIESSQRLSYTLMDHDDADLLFDLDQDEEVMRYITHGKVTSREHLNNILLPRMDCYRNEQEGWGLWKLTITDSNQFIGWVLVRPMNFFSNNVELNNLELGWRISRDSWGNGYATEAANHIMLALAANNNITKFSALAFEENTASTNIMLKLGMKYINTELHKDPLGDCELAYYELTL